MLSGSGSTYNGDRRQLVVLVSFQDQDFAEDHDAALAKWGNIFNVDPLRVRKLLVHKSEITKLDNKVSRDGYTLVPLDVYFSKGRAKVKIGLAKGKKLYDKRESIAKKDRAREAERDFKVSIKQ